MAWSAWRGVRGGGLATLLLAGSPAAAWTQQIMDPVVRVVAPPPAPQAAQTTSAAKPKPAAVKTAARHEPAHAAKKLATKRTRPAEHLAAAKARHEQAKQVEIAKQAEPRKAVAVAEAKPEPASYTITTVHDGVTQTATRVVPLTPVAGMVMPSPAAPVETRPSPAPPGPVAQAKSAVPGPQLASTQPQIVATSVSLTEWAGANAMARFTARAATARPPAPAKAAAASAPVIGPPDPKAAAVLVASFLKEAFQIAKSNGTSLQRRARLADLFAGKMDVPRIAGYTTNDQLSGVSSDIQQRFRTILVSYLVETYYPQLELASDPKVTVDTAPAEPLSNHTAVVWTTFTKDGWGSQSVKWHLLNEDGHYKIVDIFSAGASLVQMERDTFVSVMRNGGLNELMAKLDQRTKQLATAATE